MPTNNSTIKEILTLLKPPAVLFAVIAGSIIGYGFLAYKTIIIGIPIISNLIGW